MFEKASRKKYRFEYRGMISTEDLWDLKLEALDEIYKKLNAELKATQEDSLLAKKDAKTDDLETKIAIIKRVVSVKQEEAKARVEARERTKKIQRLMEIKAQKEDAGLQAMSVEELDKMINDLSEGK